MHKKCGRRMVRGITAGKTGVTMDAGMRVNATADPGYEITQNGSHTLESRDFEDRETLRARLIEATVDALADGSGPRLPRSRL
jgi:hypothetical protein